MTIFNGTANDDTLTGNSDDELYGLGGNDDIQVLGDNATLDGGDGNDQLLINEGTDNLLHGGNGDDWVAADGGSNTLFGDEGDDRLTIYLGGNNRLSGGNGDDILDNSTASFFSLANNDTLSGDAGNDSFIIGGTEHLAYGGEGNDTLSSTGDGNFLSGGNGDDTFQFGGANDEAEGGEGADIFQPLFSGDGNKVTDFTVGTDYIQLNEHLFNIRFEDLDITDDADGNAVITYDGSDLTLEGVATADLSEDDFLITYHDSYMAQGTAVADSLEGYASDDMLWGREGDDVLYGYVGDDVLGGAGGNDWIYGGDGEDTIYGAANDDFLYGDAGNDLIFNGSGADYVDGGLGNDTLWGGGGDDTLVGNGGADLFYFGAHSGNDLVADFNTDEDVLNLSYAGLADIDAVTAAATETTQDFQDGLLIALSDESSVFLVGITLDDLFNMTFAL